MTPSDAHLIEALLAGIALVLHAFWLRLSNLLLMSALFALASTFVLTYGLLRYG